MSALALRTPVPADTPFVSSRRLRVISCDGPAASTEVPAPCSPSLTTRQDRTPAYEVKFLVSESQAREIEHRLLPLLSLDPHANPLAGNSYPLTTLYCDTPALDVFHRVGRYQLFKFRLRQYGSSQQVFLECKAKRGKQVRKRRWKIKQDELPRLADSRDAGHWEGGWYQHQIARNRFRPVCILRYQRVAYFGSTSEGPIRLTFDREMCGALTSDWSLAPPARTQSLLTGRVVCEFKFRNALPAAFKGVMESLQLVPCGVSKFRHCLLESGMVPSGAIAHA